MVDRSLRFLPLMLLILKRYKHEVIMPSQLQANWVREEELLIIIKFAINICFP